MQWILGRHSRVFNKKVIYAFGTQSLRTGSAAGLVWVMDIQL